MASIKEIAKRANISIGTVDRVLHKRGRVAQETEDRIKKVIKAINYKPNIFARNLKLQKTFVFSVLMPKVQQDNRYWELPLNGILKAQSELENQNVRVKFYYHNRTSEKGFMEMAAKALNEKPDGLLIAPTLFGLVEKFIKKVPSVVPYVFFDSKIPGTNYLSYIGQDSFQSGLVSARLLKLLVPEGSCIALVNILPQYFHIDERIRGFHSYFKDTPCYDFKTFFLDIRKGNDESNRLCESILSNHKNVKGIFIPCGHVSRFAQYVFKNNLHGKIHIIGYDLIKQNSDYLKNGTIDFIISQRPEIQGYQGIYALYRHCVLKEPSPKEMILPIDIITKENMDYF